MSRRVGADWTADRTKTHSFFHLLAHSLPLAFSFLTVTLCVAPLCLLILALSRGVSSLHSTQHKVGVDGEKASDFYQATSEAWVTSFHSGLNFSPPFFFPMVPWRLWPPSVGCLNCPWGDHILSACLPSTTELMNIPISPSYCVWLHVFMYWLNKAILTVMQLFRGFRLQMCKHVRGNSKWL